MARKIRDLNLETRTRRLALPVAKKPLFVALGRGLSVGYRRNLTSGTWVLRQADGKGGFRTKAIGMADDFEEADGIGVLDFWQAQDRVKEVLRPVGGALGTISVQTAFDNYIPKLRAKNANTAKDTLGRLRKHFLPLFGSREVVELTRSELGNWHASLVKQSPDKEAVRRSKDSANRVLTMVKATLNDAWRDEKNGIPSDNSWRLVTPFPDVARSRKVRYSPEQARQLIAKCDDPSFSDLVTGAYLTGARYGELNSLRVLDFDAIGKTLFVGGKTGARSILLQSSASTFFERITSGRLPNEFVFTKSDGTAWKASDQTRPMKLAIKDAGLDERGCLYALRHAYISEAIEGNAPLTVIARNCGTSVRMIEKTYAKVLREKEREFVERGAPCLKADLR